MPDPDIPNAWYEQHERGRIGEPIVGAGAILEKMPPIIVDADETDWKRIFNGERRIGVHGKIWYTGGPKEVVYWTRFFRWYFVDIPDQVETRQFIPPLDLKGVLNSHI